MSQGAPLLGPLDMVRRATFPSLARNIPGQPDAPLPTYPGKKDLLFTYLPPRKSEASRSPSAPETRAGGRWAPPSPRWPWDGAGLLGSAGGRRGSTQPVPPSACSTWCRAGSASSQRASEAEHSQRAPEGRGVVRGSGPPGPFCYGREEGLPRLRCPAHGLAEPAARADSVRDGGSACSAVARVSPPAAARNSTRA